MSKRRYLSNQNTANNSLLTFIVLLVIGAGVFVFISAMFFIPNSRRAVLGVFDSNKRSEEKTNNENYTITTNNQITTSDYLQRKETSVVQPDSLELTLSFWGNTFWGRYTHDWSQASELGYAYPFSQLDTIGKDEYEYWITGLECPITESENTSQQQDATLTLTCRPEYLEHAKKWFDTFSLANNHTGDMNSIDGFSTTKKFLDEAGIEYFGHYDNELNEICTITSYQAKPIYSQESLNLISAGRARKQREIYQMPVALCGYHSVFRLPTIEEINQITPYSTILPTFVMPQQGAEYVTQPDSLKISTYRAYIDAGAEAVFGDHPHAVQTTEAYKNRLIVYSMGNFMFDQQFSPMVTQSLGINMYMSVPFSENVEQWQNVLTSCLNEKNCLNAAIEEEISRIQPTLTFDITATDNSNRITRLASDAVYQRLKSIALWDQLPENLKHKGR